MRSPGRPLPQNDEFLARNKSILDLIGEAGSTPAGSVMLSTMPTIPFEALGSTGDDPKIQWERPFSPLMMAPYLVREAGNIMTGQPTMAGRAFQGLRSFIGGLRE